MQYFGVLKYVRLAVQEPAKALRQEQRPEAPVAPPLVAPQDEEEITWEFFVENEPKSDDEDDFSSSTSPSLSMNSAVLETLDNVLAVHARMWLGAGGREGFARKEELAKLASARIMVIWAYAAGKN